MLNQIFKTKTQNLPAEMTNENQEILKFVPFNSCINPSFWYELNRLKLDEYMLNDDFKNLTGFFSNCKFKLVAYCVCNLRIEKKELFSL